MTSAASFRGIIPVIATAVDESGAVLEQPIRDLIDDVLEQGAHGVAGLGEGSDFHKLSVQERLQLTRTVVGHVDGRAPVMIGTSANNVDEAILFTKAAEEAGADAAFIMPPYVGDPSDAEILDHYRRIADATDIALILQDNVMPGGGGTLSLSVMSRLVDELPAIRFVKEENPPEGPRITQIVQELGERVDVISGNGGGTLLNDLARGVVGCMPGSALVRGLVQAYEAWAAGDTESAYAVFERVFRLIAFSAAHYGPATVELLCRKGVFPNAYVRPPSGPPLDEVDREELSQLLERAGDLV
jgi:dihydrodipicolinate synthase/N-acetylneuraminate lyase